MTDDELDRLLRAGRPATAADSGWADSAEGDDALAAVRAVTGRRRPVARVAGRLRPFALGIGFAAVAATVVAVGVTLPGAPSEHRRPAAGPSSPRLPAASGPVGPAPAQMALAAYDTCAGMRDALRAHTAAHVTPWGLPGSNPGFYSADQERLPGAGILTVPTADAAAGSLGTADVSAPDHSTTNDQEAGADEPDLVKTDGRRVVSVSGGVLRVVDVDTRAVTGSLDLRAYAGAQSAQLLLAGDRALVLLGAPYQFPRFGAYAAPYAASSGGSTYLLVDLAGSPSVVSTLHTDGGFVDARLVDGVARVIVVSSPHIAFPVDRNDTGARWEQARTAANRKVVQRADLSAWLPTYQTTDGGRTATHQVPCDRVSHPARYTGASMVTVYSFDPATSLDDPQAISIAADASTVYATTHDLYVASGDDTRTQLHRFALNGTGAPRYLGSGSVPGWLLDSYSLSEYDGELRVVSTGGATAQTSVYVLDARTLTRRGSVGALGVGESLHAVRFLGPLGYVVTYRSVDPLYVLDLHDPAHPRVAGRLTVTGYSDYLHPTDPGRLLGVGEDVDGRQVVDGLQVSLFDVANATTPRRLAKVVRHHAPSETPLDPHAFLYWPATRTAVVPIDSWETGESGAALVVHVGTDRLTVRGTLRNPDVVTTDAGDTGIERTLVIGSDVWTMSGSGLLVSDLASLHRRAWVPFS